MKAQNKPPFLMPNAFIGLLWNDLLTYIIAFFLAHLSRALLGELTSLVIAFPPFIDVFVSLWWLFGFIFFIYLNKGLYSSRLPFWQEASRLLSSSIIAFILIFAMIFLTKTSEYNSRLFVLFLFVYWTSLSMLLRYIFKKYYFEHGAFAERTCIIGSYDFALKVYKTFKQEGYMGYDIMGIILVGNCEKESELPILGSIDDFEDIVAKSNLRSCIVQPQGISEDRLMKLNIVFKKVITAYQGAGSAFSNIEPMQVWDSEYGFLGMKNNLKSKNNMAFKRLFDILLALILLPFLLVIIALIAVAIKLNSKGNIFYKHERVGMNGKPIYVYKFRSMYMDATDRLKEILATDSEAKKEWEKNYKLKNDPRVTKVGSFLRKTSLDELPQIFNVLKGEMSFIGPRPVIKEELEKFYKDFAVYYKNVRPGISGLWQVSGRSDADYELRIAKDMWYVLNWSIWVDVVILFKTPYIVLKRKGAY